MVYRFLHTADIHLDSPLRTLALRNLELSKLIGLATRRSFVRIVDLCLEERVDALLVAGDLYDGEQTSMKTARFLAEQLARLHQAGIRTFVIRGNHDALSKITAELVMPDTVKVFGAAAETILVDRDPCHFPVAIHGLSFAKPHAPESLLRNFPPPFPDAVNIGLLHTSLGGSPGHDLYAPCSVADLQQSGFRYWALGHIHRRSAVQGGASTIIMPGIPQGRDINEDGRKSVSLVTIRDDRSIIVEERHTAIAQFERLVIDISQAADWKDVVLEVNSRLESLSSTVSADHLVARVELTGTNDLAWRLRRDTDLLRTELELRAASVGNIWIEKVVAWPTIPGHSRDRQSGALHELASIIDEEILGSTDYVGELCSILDELRGQLPAELRDTFGRDEASFEALASQLARNGASQVLARLRNGEGE